METFARAVRLIRYNLRYVQCGWFIKSTDTTMFGLLGEKVEMVNQQRTDDFVYDKFQDFTAS